MWLKLHTSFFKRTDFPWLPWEVSAAASRCRLLLLYVHRPRTAVTQVQISLGCSRKREKYGHYVCPAEWMSYAFVFAMEVSFSILEYFSRRSLIHGCVWVKMHNEFIKEDWCNQERYWLNYWLRARRSVLPEISSRTLSTLLTNLIKCTKCYTLTSPLGAIMAVKIERSPSGGYFYLLARDCLCQLADCIDYIDL